ncbi:MAG TPA: DUF6438 domain-containing protein [Myxococcaceae bacterium]|nr:DUF6438 domain-containing protein [Myxococcaceae bacterium]
MQRKNLGAAVLLLLGCHPAMHSAASTEARDEDPVIQLLTTSCFGTCPEYLVRIFPDGRVTYVGLANVKLIGPASSTITVTALSELVRQFQAANFFAFEDSYDTGASDAPWTLLKYWRDGQSKEVGRQQVKGAGPPALVQLERSVEDAVKIERWIGQPKRRSEDHD